MSRDESISRLRALLGPVLSSEEVEVPPAAVRRAVGAFGARRTAARERRSLPRILADLLFDSLLAPAPAGARAGVVSERQLLFSAGGLDIDLRVRAQGATWHLVGQVLPEGEEFLPSDRLEVRLGGPEERARKLPVSRFGEFAAEGIPSGDQTLEITVDRRVRYECPLRV